MIDAESQIMRLENEYFSYCIMGILVSYVISSTCLTISKKCLCVDFFLYFRGQDIEDGYAVRPPVLWDCGFASRAEYGHFSAFTVLKVV
jgi:hypothetical protein